MPAILLTVLPLNLPAPSVHAPLLTLQPAVSVQSPKSRSNPPQLALAELGSPRGNDQPSTAGKGNGTTKTGQAASYQSTSILNLKAPSTRFQDANPLPGAPSITIDSVMDENGIANSVAKNRDLQARIIWIDGTANIDKVNDEDKIVALVAQIKKAGFNTIVFDVKPISGQTLYPSLYAPKIQSWRDQNLPQGFDPLAIMAREAKINNISLVVSMNAFSEGHQLFKVGPGYDLKDEQAVIYQPRVVLQSPKGASYPCDPNPNEMPSDASEIGMFNDSSKLPAPDPTFFAVTLGPGNVVIDGFEGGGIGKGVPTIPTNGVVLVGRGNAGDFLRSNATPGQVLPYSLAPSLQPISESADHQIPLMMNPNDPRVQSRIISMVREVATKYPIDGVMFDDRLRYPGQDGDFSDTTKELFSSFVGAPVNWPVDVYSYTLTTDLHRGFKPGKYWDAWQTFRALSIRNFVAKVRIALKATRPDCKLGVYTGSWYGEYPNLGSNWGSPSLSAGFWFLTPTYTKTGFAPLLDFLITGCYYQTATIHQAFAYGGNPALTVESAGALSNRVVRDATWVYAGISLDDFHGNPDGLLSALSAACATTQGVMVFDLSHDIDPMWPVFQQAFSSVRKPPHDDAAALQLVRTQRASIDARHLGESPVIIMAGSAGTGQ